MTPDQFFAKFALFADTPNAVAKMRELILDLAVRGKLVPQNPSDGTAAQLTEKISSQSVWQKRKTDNSTTVVSPLFQIPLCWEWIRLAAISLNIQYGYTASADETITDVRLLRITDIQNNRVNWSLVPGCVINGDDLGRYLLADNDILIARTGGTIGKSFIVSSVTVKAVFASYLIRVRLVDSICPQYIKLFLESPLYWSQLRNMSAGTGQPNVNGQALGSLLLPIPPFAEQKRIVAKVDELMALCDQLESQQKQRETKKATLVQAALTRFTDAPTPANLEFLFHKSYAIDPAELRKTILTLAVTGRIVTQDYTDESAHDMLLRMSLSNGVDDGVRNKFLDVDLPQNWTKILFEEVAQIASGVTLGRKLGDRRTVTLPYLRVANVKRGEIDISDVKTVAIGEDEIERFALRAGDLLMIEGGDWDKVGRAAIWRGEIPNCLHQNHVFRVRMRTSELLPVWFERYINSPIGRRYFENAAKQTTNLASINMRQVRACPIPLPPLAEQKRIVAKVEELMALVDKLEAQLAASRDAGAKLIEAVVAAIAAAA